MNFMMECNKTTLDPERAKIEKLWSIFTQTIVRIGFYKIRSKILQKKMINIKRQTENQVSLTYF